MVVPLYISEISPPEIRGSLLVFEQLSIVVGIVISFWITCKHPQTLSFMSHPN